MAHVILRNKGQRRNTNGIQNLLPLTICTNQLLVSVQLHETILGCMFSLPMQNMRTKNIKLEEDLEIYYYIILHTM
jgi:hypothetical protein